ncbi:MAG: alpha/beta hydrolase [Dongiaceae bacterium]
MTPQFLDLNGRKLAYQHLPGDKTRPGILFLTGFRSDMTGGKATYLQEWAEAHNIQFTRFDYSGHGQSEGKFEDGTISSWCNDALAVLEQIAAGPQILAGSSMGGWIALLLALKRKERVKALTLIAPAPDFTEDLLWPNLSTEQRQEIEKNGVIYLPNDYDERPYPITWQLIEDGRKNLLLRDSIPLACPVRILQGKLDDAVPYATALRLKEKLQSKEVKIHLIEDGDHRLSRDQDLELLRKTVEDLLLPAP